jgi:hypothetical protein
MIQPLQKSQLPLEFFYGRFDELPCAANDRAELARMPGDIERW